MFYNGYRIVANELALEETQEPKMVHNPRKGGGDNYHKRIQKKWIKRYGYVMIPCCFMMKGIRTIIMHPTLYRQFKHQIEMENRYDPKREILTPYYFNSFSPNYKRG